MFDPSDDFVTVTDGAEAVTLLRRGSTLGVAGTVITHALRRAMTAGEAPVLNRGDVRKKVASSGRHTAATVVWHLPIAGRGALPRTSTPHVGKGLAMKHRSLVGQIRAASSDSRVQGAAILERAVVLPPPGGAVKR